MIAWVHHWLYEDFWCLVWPNAGAVPLCAIVSLTWVFVFRDRLGRRLVAWLHKHYEAYLAERAELERRRHDNPV